MKNKRKTVNIRVHADSRDKLKILAIKNGQTLMGLIDQLASVFTSKIRK